MVFKVFSVIGVFMVFLIAFSHGSTIRPSILIKLAGSETVGGTTSPTISVQRFGESTFYNYIKSTPATEASPPPSSSIFSKAEEQEENPTTPELASSSTPPATSTDPTDNSSSTNKDEDDSDEESHEERVSTGEGLGDDAEISETTPKPVVPVIVDGSGHTEIPVVLPQAPPASIQDTSDGDADPSQPDAPDTEEVDSNDGENNGGDTPSDQTAPPAEAVPGQPGEHDPSSSSEESSSSSSSSEEFKQAYRKVWEYNNKIKSKETQLLARLQSKLGKKEKSNKYSYQS